MDDDGDDDLIIGGANGKLNYFERMGCIPNIVCNNRGSCSPNDVDGLLPVCKCSTADAVGNQCEFCAPGFIESKKIGAQSLGSQIGVVCASCVAGFWSGTTSFGVSVADSASAADAVAGNIPSACTQCASGRFGVTFTATSIASCAECPVGWVDSKSTSGIVTRTSCDPCLPGSVQPTPATFAGCDDCVAGKVQQNKAQTACVDCNTGKFMDQAGQTTCLDCLPGTKMVATSAAQTSCDDCSDGTVQPIKGQTTCDDCNTGKFMDQAGQTTCLDCLPGTKMAATSGAQTSCDDCSSGQVQPDKGQTTCDDCSSGRATDSVGSVRCPSCGVGMYTDEMGQEECVGCAPGQYRPSKESDGITSSDSTKCVHCPTGWVSEAESAKCQPCEAGTFSSIQGESCKNCDSGQYRQSKETSKDTSGFTDKITNPTRCVNCPTGWTSGTGSTKCQACGAGTFGEGCQQCPKGYARNGTDHDATQCRLCKLGETTTLIGRASCERW